MENNNFFIWCVKLYATTKQRLHFVVATEALDVVHVNTFSAMAEIGQPEVYEQLSRCHLTVMLSRGHYDHPAIRSRSCKPREQVGQC
jgi:hypothetical protein